MHPHVNFGVWAVLLDLRRAHVYEAYSLGSNHHLNAAVRFADQHDIADRYGVDYLVRADQRCQLLYAEVRMMSRLMRLVAEVGSELVEAYS